MKLRQRLYQGTRDQQQMLALVRSNVRANFHVVDLPYRFSSWAFDNPANIALWEDETGALQAWAILQTPFWAIDYAFHPDAPLAIQDQILDWADRQARANLNTEYGRAMWFVNVFDWQQDRRDKVEAHGFASQADVGEDSWTKVLLLHQPAHGLADSSLPEGYQLRPLAGATEVDAYVALHQAVFGSKNMTAAWRARTLQHPDYQPAIDLVIADPDGQLAAFCICWFTPNGIDGRPSGQIEPLGVRADQREYGLGRAILSEAVRRLYAKGAEHVVVETDNYRDAAFALYEAVGFRVVENVLVYRKDYEAQ